MPTFRIANVDDVLSVFSNTTQLTVYHKSLAGEEESSIALAQRALVYVGTSDVIMKELNGLLDRYQTAVDYYAMELSSLFLPSDYMLLKRRECAESRL